jgi:hypothetical protein
VSRRSEPIRAEFQARNPNECRMLIAGKLKLVGQARGNLARRSTRISFELLYQVKRAANAPRELGLGQIEALRRRLIQMPSEMISPIGGEPKSMIWLLTHIEPFLNPELE